jgi:RNA polymerase sigma-70 factor (ECF subfamily)
MTDEERLATEFEGHRAHLAAVAYRMLGTHAEADDAVQETWLRLSRAESSQISNLGGWLTTVTSRICLDILRSRTSRREDSLDDMPGYSELSSTADGADPEADAVLADAMGPALLVVLDTLRPAERLAFVLHDLFGVPFDEIATIVDRTPDAARQLASRARRRVRGSNAGSATDPTRQREIVQAFLDASRNGEFEKLVALLDPDIILRADDTVVATAAARHPIAPPIESEIRGAHAVASTFSGRARTAKLALIDGVVGAVWAPGRKPRVLFSITVEGGRVVAIDVIGDASALSEHEVEILP